MRSLPADSCDLVLGSPPYTKQRTYGINFNKDGEEWVDWMVEVFREASRVCKGLVCMVVEGATRNYRWSATPALLMADLHRAGFTLRRPLVYHRVGIPGSGGPDWMRADTEWLVCVTRPGKLPWSDNTVMGHPPKWAPGGEMSHRLPDGTRVNYDPEDPWDKHGRGNHIGGRDANGRTKKGTLAGRDEWGMQGGSGMRRANGKRRTHGVKTGAVSGHKNGDTLQEGVYQPPVLANPGNVIFCKAGGGQIGSRLAHANEAPFPELLCEFVIRSFCPPDGVVCDPFLGSGTTCAVAVRWQRRAIGCDVRQSMIGLTERRMAGVTPELFPGTKVSP
jgi:hypothetical protein